MGCVSIPGAGPAVPPAASQLPCLTAIAIMLMLSFVHSTRADWGPLSASNCMAGVEQGGHPSPCLATSQPVGRLACRPPITNCTPGARRTRALAKWLSGEIRIQSRLTPDDTVLECTSGTKGQLWHLAVECRYCYNFIIYALAVWTFLGQEP